MTATAGFVSLLVLFVSAGVAYTALRVKPPMSLFCPICGNPGRRHDDHCPLRR